MLEYNRIDISEVIGIKKLNESKEFKICHYCYFKDISFKYELHLSNGCHGLMQKAVSFNNIDIVYMKGSAYIIHFWYMSICFSFLLPHLLSPFFGWLEDDGCCASFFVFSLFSLFLVPLTRVTSAEKLLCLLCKTILKVSYLIIFLWITLEKGECFDFSHTLEHVCPTLYIFRLLGRVYYFSWLICYPCPFYFHPLMLVAFWSANSLLLVTLGKIRNLPQILIRS